MLALQASLSLAHKTRSSDDRNSGFRFVWWRSAYLLRVELADLLRTELADLLRTGSP